LALAHAQCISARVGLAKRFAAAGTWCSELAIVTLGVATANAPIRL